MASTSPAQMVWISRAILIISRPPTPPPTRLTRRRLSMRRLIPLAAASGVLSDGNLYISKATGGTWYTGLGTMGVPPTGKWAFKFTTPTALIRRMCSPVFFCRRPNSGYRTRRSKGVWFAIQVSTGAVDKRTGGSTSTVTTVTAPAASLMRIEYNADTDAIEIFDDNTSVYSGTTGIVPSGPLFPIFGPYASGSSEFDANFGAAGLPETPTSGYVALNSANIYANDPPAIEDGTAHFQTTLYTGTSAIKTVTQSGNSTFPPDLVWIKDRGSVASHALYDVLRGVNKQLSSNNTDAELTSWSDLVTAFNSDGFSLGADATVSNVNVSAHTYAAWQWKGGGAGVANTDGSISVQL
jgi:hypothetical protein